MGHTFMHLSNHDQLLQCRQSSLLDNIQDSAEEWRRDVGGMEAEGVVVSERLSENPENPDVESSNPFNSLCVFI